MEGSHQDGSLGEMKHFGLKQKLHSEPMEGKWGSGTNALLAPLLSKTLLAVAHCSGTEWEEHQIQAKLLGTCEWLGHPIWQKQR